MKYEKQQIEFGCGNIRHITLSDLSEWHNHPYGGHRFLAQTRIVQNRTFFTADNICIAFNQRIYAASAIPWDMDSPTHASDTINQPHTQVYKIIQKL